MAANSSSSMAAKTITASSSSSSSSGLKYDVFLSFRGKDTRNNFTGHFYKALDQKGIDTFIDDKKLRRGEEISPTLLTAIRRSRCSIIVLSENYAFSKWCLEELVEILVCKRTKNQRVVPIFYNVDPSHVRNQTGSFGQAMAKHEKNKKINKEKVHKWREALTQVANLSGFHSLNKSEAQLIEEIILDVCKDLNCVPSEDTQFLVGVDSCITELELLLCLESIDVRMLGIWGMGGIGKTTLARAIYERISHKFEGSCFLANVEKLAEKGEDYLKKKLLSSILRDKNIDATTTSLKAKLHSKKVLIVVDNVNHRSILKILVGECNWFGPHSRIIITTRDKQVLAMHGVNIVYEVQKLQDGKDIEVFSYYAFRNDFPSRDVMNLIPRVMAHAQGLPLALEVLGSSLCKKSKDEWICALNKLEKIPNKKIQEVLQISFDELDNNEKNIFLDIAFAFEGFKKGILADFMDSCGFFATSGIRTIIDKSLISTIDDVIEMYDLLKEMGMEIIRQTCPEDPGKRSRLWMQQDICNVLERHTGTEKVEIIFLPLNGLKEIRFTTAAFAKMTKLRVLMIFGESSPHEMQCKVHISDDFKLHGDELRVLVWVQYPLKSLPDNFLSKNLLWLAIDSNCLTHLWEGNKIFETLKCVSLTNCRNLRETPDFSGATNVETLTFDGCRRLHKIHPSLGCLYKLKVLSFVNCTSLKCFPGIDDLVSLEVVDLSGCSKLEKFPNISKPMPCLSGLNLDGTAITELPSSIGYHATGLIILDLTECRDLRSLPSSICELTCLEILSLFGCSNLTELPRTLDRLSSLRILDLEDCISLSELPPLASSLQLVDASNCSSLERISPQSVLSYGGSIFTNCIKLREYPNMMERDFLSMATSHIADEEKWRSSTYDQQNPNVQVPFSSVFPGSAIPNWFKHQSSGGEIDIKVSPNWYTSNFLGFAVSAVMKIEDGSSTYCNLEYSHDGGSESVLSTRICSFTDDHTRELEDIRDDHLWMAYVPSVFSFDSEKWSRIKFSFNTNNVKRCGISPVYIKSSSSHDSGLEQDDAYNQEIGCSFTDHERLPNLSISKMETVSRVFITIFVFLFLASIFLVPLIRISRPVLPLLPSPFSVPILLCILLLFVVYYY